MELNIDKLHNITDRLSHAYIADSHTAKLLATAVVCCVRDGNRPCMTCNNCIKAQKQIHPDITTINRIDNKRDISVGQIRELKQDVYILPNDSMQKAYVIEDAETMNTSAQNALLQILEEPPAHTVFILSTTNPTALLPTIRSRCIELGEHTSPKNKPNSPSDSDASESEHNSTVVELSNDFVEAINNNLKLMDIMFRLDKLDRFSFEEFILCTRKQIVSNLRTDSCSLREKFLRTDSLLLKSIEMLDLNVSIGHISGMICANLLDD